MRHASVLASILILVVTVSALAQTGSGKKRRPLPYEYGRVVMNNTSEKAGLAPVAFDHWVHRAKFTCRLCHVDLGFAMTAGGTDIKAKDNASGYYCGACHNGAMKADDRRVFESCVPGPAAHEPKPACLRCHARGKEGSRLYDFTTFTGRLPKGRFGNGVDWEKAEEQGLIKPVDVLEGVSIPRPAIAAQKDFALSPEQRGMPEIVFSHGKHTVWNGCETCHPEIFSAVKKGGVKYTMSEIFAGKYCGACHVSVAFPLQDCQRCHAKPVQ